MLLARVALPVPLAQAFTYRVDGPRPEPGARVLCPFGRRPMLGVVLSVSEGEPDFPVEKLRPLGAVVDDGACLPAELLGFIEALASYYLAPIGEVVRMALPAFERLRARELAEQGLAEGVRFKSTGRVVQTARWKGPPDADLSALTGQTRAVAERLAASGGANLAELARDWSQARAAVRRLVDRGLVELGRAEQRPDRFFAAPIERDVPPELTEAQASAIGRLGEALEAGVPRSFLLEGVTGSGKTEVYLRAVERCLAAGGDAIVLVPEIALTPQLVGRFRARLGDGIAVLHSGLSEGERHHMWKKLRSRELRVAIGARSALFAPVASLRLLCVDEEHDASFKQDEGVRYHARDMAMLRAHRAGAVCVLGSATPSLTTEGRVRQGKLTRLRLPNRANAAARLPTVELVDLRRHHPAPGGQRLLTVPLLRALARRLERGEQAILFLNRRGYAPRLLCEACGTIHACQNCSVALTLHRARGARLQCHYCDAESLVPARCPACAAVGRFVELGAGTERIEEALAQALPAARIGRLDRDVAAGLKSEATLAKMRSRELDILVGTQMVTKGHDLPGVTLVGVLNADAALSLPDFRAAERTFQLMVQVAGRSGRADQPGTVLIQTYQPEHPSIAFATRHDVAGFAAHELAERRALRYPPFSHLALVRVSALDAARAESEASRLAAVAAESLDPRVELVGPAPAPVARIQNRWRHRFLLRATEDRRLLRRPLARVLAAATDHAVRVSVDIDPENML